MSRQYGRRFPKATPIVFALIIFGSLGIFFIRSQPPNHQPVLPIAAIADNTTRNQSSLDSDADDLKDWEEQIYNTDPHNPDTDGDGTKDGEEIAQGRNPLQSGPSDILIKKTDLTASPPSKDQINLTERLVDILGQDYIATFVKNPNGQIDANTVVDKLINAMQDSVSMVPEFAVKDIDISHDTSKENTHRYLTTFDATLITAFGSAENIANTMKIVETFVKNQEDDAALTKLQKRIDSYTTFLANIKKVPVPKDFVTIHLNYLNTMQKTREALKRITQIRTDIAVGVVGMRQLLDTTHQFKDIANTYHQLAQAKGITLSP